jgi:hypothetical protein
MYYMYLYKNRLCNVPNEEEMDHCQMQVLLR